ncbi:hypothetical protein JAAARDRAFT_39690 [Jaapia argillacea MUCL 33604]|uniref:G domain-containing protein n=1 Tax=Jaapia argillacea MUCL 33604 TaxID=933084 RepID=A0A067PDL6_9AGAM|nr:hypothetical protein JAAARDRAFT_39690 [Jaapia argillacea MUCL 33604]
MSVPNLVFRSGKPSVLRHVFPSLSLRNGTGSRQYQGTTLSSTTIPREHPTLAMFQKHHHQALASLSRKAIAHIAESESDPPGILTRNVIVFGESGVGKSSVINLVAGLQVANTAETGCTFRSQKHVVPTPHMTLNLFDTVGLNRDSEWTTQSIDAIKDLYLLVHNLEGGLNLLVHVVKASGITALIAHHYRMVFKGFCQRHVPIVLVITGLEHESDPDRWWRKHRHEFNDWGMVYSGQACVTATTDHSKHQRMYSKSRPKVVDLITQWSSPEPWMMITEKTIRHSALRKTPLEGVSRMLPEVARDAARALPGIVHSLPGAGRVLPRVNRLLPGVTRVVSDVNRVLAGVEPDDFLGTLHMAVCEDGWMPEEKVMILASEIESELLLAAMISQAEEEEGKQPSEGGWFGGLGQGTVRTFTSPPVTSPPELHSLYPNLPLDPSESQRSRFDLALQSQWNIFQRWSLRPGHQSSKLVEMHWCKEPEAPGHEYIVLKFTAPYTSTWVRMERDSTSWLSVFGQQEEARRNCKDMLKVRDGIAELTKPHDRLMASITVSNEHSSAIHFLHLSLLQHKLNEKAPVYDLTTFNCWWYAGCIWESVAYWLRQSGTEVVFKLNAGTHDDEMVREMVQVHAGTSLRPLDWEATIFPRKLLQAHLLTARRALPGQRAGKKLDDVSKASEEIRVYCAKEIHEIARGWVEKASEENSYVDVGYEIRRKDSSEVAV